MQAELQAEHDEYKEALDRHVKNRTRSNKLILAIEEAMRAEGVLPHIKLRPSATPPRQHAASTARQQRASSARQHATRQQRRRQHSASAARQHGAPAACRHHSSAPAALPPAQRSSTGPPAQRPSLQPYVLEASACNPTCSGAPDPARIYATPSVCNSTSPPPLLHSQQAGRRTRLAPTRPTGRARTRSPTRSAPWGASTRPSLGISSASATAGPTGPSCQLPRSATGARMRRVL